MRGLFLFIPAMLMAQTTPPPKAPAPKAATTPPKAAGAPTKAATPGVAKKAAPTTTMTDDQKTVYAIGLAMYKSLQQFELSPAEMDLVKKALTDAAAGKPAVDGDLWLPK